MKTTLSVGILSATKVRFCLNGEYTFNGNTYKGEQSAEFADEYIVFDGQKHHELFFEGGSSFVLYNVSIGIQFHWQRKETQRFAGSLKIIIGKDKVLADKEGLIAINIVDIEDYLSSVISSEMSASSSVELLKAQAVVARSWLLHPILNPSQNISKPKFIESSDKHIKWYERDAHSLFNVCADDHCQRYQGITQHNLDNVIAAIEGTRGEVLISTQTGEICDARYHKSCGGKTEVFETCWADTHFSYLESVEDSFCNTSDRQILQQVLNNYDQTTTDFYRWQVSYSNEELAEIIRERSGIDFGQIKQLIPIKRGPSGRIYELKIVGTIRTITIGKELEIRKWLSRTHLYSSAFTIEQTTDGFILHGSGWGHGVGLCQIGAAIMANQGIDYTTILHHYFPNTTIKKL